MLCAAEWSRVVRWLAGGVIRAAVLGPGLRL